MRKRSLSENVKFISEQLLVLDQLDASGREELATSFFAIKVWTDDFGHAELSACLEEFSELIQPVLNDFEAVPLAHLPLLKASMNRYMDLFGRVWADDEPSDAMADLTMDLLQNREILDNFFSEATDHIDKYDESLLILDEVANHKEALNAVFRAMHTLKSIAGFLGYSALGEITHLMEDLIEGIRAEGVPVSEPILDVAFQTSRAIKTELDHLRKLDQRGEVPQPSERIAGDAKLLQEAHAGLAVSGDPAGPAWAELPEAPELGEAVLEKGPDLKTEIKVDVARLDMLIDTIGELVITETMINKSEELRQVIPPEWADHFNALDKITRHLQQIGTSLRMIPLRNTFQRINILSRELAKQEGKKIEFKITGEETELDKFMVDRIWDPLVHLVRNAIGHGIEGSEAKREERGKPVAGRLELSAYHKGGNIYIELVDDGNGLDKERILETVKKEGLDIDQDSLSDAEIHDLIFLPGLSTAANLSELSGRGIGMEVVRRTIESMHGFIEIESEEEVGTRFVIRLPLTLAIIDGMITRVGKERYIIPSLSIAQAFRPACEVMPTIFGRHEVMQLGEEVIPLHRLNRLFGIAGGEDRLGKGIVVVLDDMGRRMGLFVDELIGQQQIVVKNLGPATPASSGIASGTILSNGEVGLIIDVSGLIRLTQAGKTKQAGTAA